MGGQTFFTVHIVTDVHLRGSIWVREGEGRSLKERFLLPSTRSFCFFAFPSLTVSELGQKGKGSKSVRESSRLRVSDGHQPPSRRLARLHILARWSIHRNTEHLDPRKSAGTVLSLLSPLTIRHRTSSALDFERYHAGNPIVHTLPHNPRVTALSRVARPSINRPSNPVSRDSTQPSSLSPAKDRSTNEKNERDRTRAYNIVVINQRIRILFRIEIGDPILEWSWPERFVASRIYNP